MATYKVIWEIDIEAGDYKEAAEMALDIQRDKESTATIFEVSDQNGTVETIDLYTK